MTPKSLKDCVTRKQAISWYRRKVRNVCDYYDKICWQREKLVRKVAQMKDENAAAKEWRAEAFVSRVRLDKLNMLRDEYIKLALSVEKCMKPDINWDLLDENALNTRRLRKVHG